VYGNAACAVLSGLPAAVGVVATTVVLPRPQRPAAVGGGATAATAAVLPGLQQPAMGTGVVIVPPVLQGPTASMPRNALTQSRQILTSLAARTISLAIAAHQADPANIHSGNGAVDKQCLLCQHAIRYMPVFPSLYHKVC